MDPKYSGHLYRQISAHVLGNTVYGTQYGSVYTTVCNMVPTDDMLLISRSVKRGSERNLHLKTPRKPIKEPTNAEVKPETYMKHLYTIQGKHLAIKHVK